jgi:acetolactate synthase-1/2/3 large subunit
MFSKPKADAKVYHIDCDPLKERMSMHYLPSNIRAKADCAIALSQLSEYVNTQKLPEAAIKSRKDTLLEGQKARRADLAKLETPASGGIMTAPSIMAAFRKVAPKNTLIMNEAISNYPHVW